MRSNGAARAAFGPGCSGARGPGKRQARRPAGSAGKNAAGKQAKKKNPRPAPQTTSGGTRILPGAGNRNRTCNLLITNFEFLDLCCFVSLTIMR